ncbi:YchJ family protein [Endozoicomonas sp.]|uniref:YchJ family protein n=1 Tax=Endozoicomonas sp. TaxID=1892382 RepID=UPI0028847FED|nr:YchJ family protein [Endozoicomonas sp.]
MRNQPSNCPCCSGKPFAECCSVFLEGTPAPTAETLMRSRYTAYTLENTEYLVATTIPGQQAPLRAQKLHQQSHPTLWQRLEIIETEAGKPSDETGVVEFKAWFKESISGVEKAQHERSSFLKEDGRWFFIYPNLPQTKTSQVGRNDPCPCGSGKKYKKCCAQNN